MTPWTVIHQAPLSMGFSREEYWSGWPCPPPGDLPHPGIEPVSLMPPALAGGVFATSTTWEVPSVVYICVYKTNTLIYTYGQYMGSPHGSDGEESACNARDLGSIPGLGRSPGEGNSNPLQYSCLENPMDRGALSTVHGVTEWVMTVPLTSMLT